MFDEVTTPRLVVTGPSSGSGKTSVALGLVGALVSRNRTVQTYKVGPDVIDCAYLAHVSRRPCRNLDAWMLGPEGVRTSLAHGAAGADCIVVEGVGGLYDGHTRSGEQPGGTRYRFPGSTAEVARILNAPVILVLDVSTMAETAAAVALGLRQLDPRLNLIGVILDNVPGSYRRRVVEDAIWDLATLPVLGAIPHIPSVRIPELRSGLLPLTQNTHVDTAVGALAEAVVKHCDLDLIERLMERAGPVSAPVRHVAPVEGPPVRVGVAFDDAFCFGYAENLELMQEAGAEIVPFSPLEDRVLPRELDAIYFGGGVAEAYVHRLAGNNSFRESFRRAVAQGVPTYCECGGLLYSARSVTTAEGTTQEMAGIVPVDLVVESGALHTGYRELRLANNCILGPAGTRVRGHEYHFSRLVNGGECLSPAYSMHDSDGEPLGCEGWATGSFLASFVHLHFGQDAGLARRFVDAGRRRAAGRRLAVMV